MSLLPLLLAYQINSHYRFVTAEQEAVTLSARLRQQIFVAKTLRSEVLFIDGHGADPETEASAVAQALHGTLSKNLGGWLIERMPEQRAAINRVRVKERAAWILRTLNDRQIARNRMLDGGTAYQAINDNIDRALKLYKPPLSQEAEIEAMKPLLDCELLMPAAKLLDSIVSRVTPMILATIPTGDYRVFETDPVAPDIPMPDIRDLTAEFTRSMSRLQSSPSFAQIADPASAIAPPFFMADMNKAAAVSKSRLMVSATLDGLFLTLELFDPFGARVGYALMSVVKPGSVSPTYMAMKKTADEHKSIWIPVSDSVAKCASFRSRKGEAPDWFMHPDKREPLSIVAAPGFCWLASQSPRKCVVIDVPDSSFSDACNCVKEKQFDAAAFLSVLRGAELVETVESNQAEVWRSRDPEWVESSRSDRKELARFARGVERSELIDPRDEGTLFHYCRGLYADWRAAAQAYTQNGNSDQNALLAVIGAISDSNWRALLSGSTLTAGELEVTSELARVLSMEPEVAGVTKLSDLYKHPMEMYGEYRLKDTPISLRSQVSELVQLVTSSKVYGWVDINELPIQMVHYHWQLNRKAATRETLGNYLQSNCSFNIGHRTDVTMIVGLPGEHFIEQHLGNPVDEEATGRSFNQMPQSFRQSALDSFSRALKILP